MRKGYVTNYYVQFFQNSVPGGSREATDKNIPDPVNHELSFLH
jgi:hypothetical protein